MLVETDASLTKTLEDFVRLYLRVAAETKILEEAKTAMKALAKSGAEFEVTVDGQKYSIVNQRRESINLKREEEIKNLLEAEMPGNYLLCLETCLSADKIVGMCKTYPGLDKKLPYSVSNALLVKPKK